MEPQNAGTDARDKGIRFIEVGKLEEAGRELAIAVLVLPEDAESSYLLGYVRLLEGRWTDARKLLERATELDPAHVKAHSKLGLAHAKLRDFKAAEKSFGEVVRLAPEDPVARKNHGGALRDLERFAEARAELRHALRLDRNYADAYHALGLLESRLGHVDTALRMHRSAVEIEPAHADAHNQIGTILARRGSTEEAASHFERAVAAKPDHAIARFNLAEAQRLLGKVDLSVAEFERVAALQPKHPKVHAKLAELYDSQGSAVKAAAARRTHEKLQLEILEDEG